MAITPNPLINDESTLLLNQDSTTFQILFKDLSANVLNYISGGGDKNDGPILEIGDNLDVDTSIYISQYEKTTGAPSSTMTFDSNNGSSLDDINDAGAAGDMKAGNKYWMLQWVNGTVSGVHDTSNKNGGQFVLRDPRSIFREVVDSIQGNVSDSLIAILDTIAIIDGNVDGINVILDKHADSIGGLDDAINALELNSLLDVKTRNGGDTDPALSNTVNWAVAGDAFLLASDTTKGADGTIIPEYEPASLTSEINQRVTNGDIEINVDDLTDVDPTDLGRLKINVLYNPGGSELKYEVDGTAPKYDDILVYITNPSTEVKGAGASRHSCWLVLCRS